MKRFYPSFMDLILLLVGAAVFLYGVHQSQTGPHHRTVKLGTKVIADEMLTNSTEILATAATVLTSTGTVTVLQYETNRLWSVWPIFGK